jgi:hypothetical protein
VPSRKNPVCKTVSAQTALEAVKIAGQSHNSLGFGKLLLTKMNILPGKPGTQGRADRRSDFYMGDAEDILGKKSPVHKNLPKAGKNYPAMAYTKGF